MTDKLTQERQGAVDAQADARAAVSRAPADRDEARRYFKREAARLSRDFDKAYEGRGDDSRASYKLSYLATLASRMRREAEDRA